MDDTMQATRRAAVVAATAEEVGCLFTGLVEGAVLELGHAEPEMRRGV